MGHCHERFILLLMGKAIYDGSYLSDPEYDMSSRHLQRRVLYVWPAQKGEVVSGKNTPQ